MIDKHLIKIDLLALFLKQDLRLHDLHFFKSAVCECKQSTEFHNKLIVLNSDTNIESMQNLLGQW